MAMAIGVLVLALLSLSSTTVFAKDYCVYTIFVKTGWLPKAGTDSSISTQFFDSKGNSYKVDSLTEWGGNLLDADHDYFERNNVDVFSGLGECLNGPICGLNLTSDGTGDHHGWYCDYVEVTSSGVGKSCNNHHFTIEQWLATDAYPYSLTSTKDECAEVTSGLSSSE
ncbi:hypothetical protein MPTK1_8g00030 [Marchantia polymorpha subsp. ruderalis]|uniref:PLAT domain-containing protein n=2 Tax=Marchantia polymorpha TaxID=3197 RepID=A0A176VC70_MARPO|nr:hypothetical protein AXG93_163s1410 [Marchantia polymorpha subsp. ruderalis]PTQ34749.1 hypothetical protein MARPO_0077s0065 [Marchantia polymorpha]BBN18133.1 hypothetical protein Mp_8g00030 [Marchantia polymorpha subsp. ruderalis]|eukprot:PTQ34749.1 hypothetical protein MARPO_0077s0065 [Marchantia polymorpha]